MLGVSKLDIYGAHAQGRLRIVLKIAPRVLDYSNEYTQKHAQCCVLQRSTSRVTVTVDGQRRTESHSTACSSSVWCVYCCPWAPIVFIATQLRIVRISVVVPDVFN